MFYHLDFYSDEELTRIIKNSAERMGIEIDAEAALAIASRSRGTPRIANRLLRRVRDYVQVESLKRIDRQAVEKSLEALRIDKGGLDEIDRKVLRTLIEVYNGGPAGIESLSAHLNEETDTIVDCIEPYLLKAGYLKRTSRGRVVTELAYKHLNIPYKSEQQRELF